MKGRCSSINLARGQIGQDSSSLLGGLLVTTLGLAAFSRAHTRERHRRDFFVYIDEFQSFTTLAMANMFSELRKYRVGFTVAHQYLHQLEEDVRHAVLGNVGTVISFRVGAEDAPSLVREFHERFDEIDLLQLPNYRIYLKLMIDGMPSKPFSAVTLDPRLPTAPVCLDVALEASEAGLLYQRDVKPPRRRAETHTAAPSSTCRSFTGEP